MEKSNKVNVTPVSYPTVKWEGIILSIRKHKYLGRIYKVQYDCGGMFLTGNFQEKELELI